MQPNNLTALDFEDIKSSIKSYLSLIHSCASLIDDEAFGYLTILPPVGVSEPGISSWHPADM